MVNPFSVDMPAVGDDPETPAPVREAVAEFAKLRASYRTEDRELESLRTRLEEAEAEDAQEGADAIRAGRKQLPASKADKLRPDLAGRERRVRALERAVTDSFASLVETIEQERAGWVATLEQTAQDRRAALVECIERVEQAEGALTASLSRAAWLRGFPERAHSKPARIGKVRLARPSGEPYSSSELLEGLREHAEGVPEPAPSGLRPKPL